MGKEMIVQKTRGEAGDQWMQMKCQHPGWTRRCDGCARVGVCPEGMNHQKKIIRKKDDRIFSSQFYWRSKWCWLSVTGTPIWPISLLGCPISWHMNCFNSHNGLTEYTQCYTSSWFLLVFWDKASLYSPCWPWIHAPLPSVSWVRGRWGCVGASSEGRSRASTFLTWKFTLYPNYTFVLLPATRFHDFHNTSFSSLAFFTSNFRSLDTIISFSSWQITHAHCVSFDTFPDFYFTPLMPAS